jgi:hypothetical protein
VTRAFSPGWVPGAPFLLSFALSLSTLGSGPGWQDSGLYLVAVRELGVLYPPGFVVYLLLCKAWTLLLGFVGFTTAVHLFSSACAAGAAAVLSVAARDWMRGGSGALRVGPTEPEAHSDLAASAAGCIAASGYTFWSSGLCAKGYSLYYLLLALLLWRLIRASQERRPRDFTALAVLAGIAWAVHPSAALLLPALLFFALAHRREFGFLGAAWRSGLGILCAIGPSLVLLPAFSARDPWLKMGDPGSISGLLDHLLGRRFTSLPGVFGYSESRFRSFGQYFWEEFLGIGVLLVIAGLLALVRLNRKALAGLACWILPVAAVTLLFKIEGQHDYWLVAAWLPLHLVGSLSLRALARASGSRPKLAIAGAAAAALAWAIVVNGPLLGSRGSSLPREFARAYLLNLDRNAVLLLESDDPIALCGYLQRIDHEREDVALVRVPFLDARAPGGDSWYDRDLLRRNPALKPPDYASFARRYPRADADEVRKGAFLEANARGERAIFLQHPVPQPLLPRGCSLAPAGGLWKLVPDGREPVDLRYWRHSREPEEVRRLYRRERGQAVTFHRGRIEVEPEAYERRFLLFLLAARAQQADLLLNAGRPDQAAAAYESILALDPLPRRDPETLFALALACRAIGREDRAMEALRETLANSPSPSRTAEALVTLGEIHRARGDARSAAQCFRGALETPDLDPAERARLEERTR